MPETAHCDPCTEVEVLFTSLIPDPRTLAANKNYVVPGIVWDNKIGEKLVSTGHTSVSVGASVRKREGLLYSTRTHTQIALTLESPSGMESFVNRFQPALLYVGVD